MTAVDDGLVVAPVDPTSDDGRAVLRCFFADIIGRYWDRPATDAEVATVMAAEPSDDLRGETGVLLAARVGGSVVGCAGVRVVEPGLGEVTRVFVDASVRGLGTGAALLTALEPLSIERGLGTLRLTVREDLVEARRLYERLGYRPVVRFSDDVYADRFLAKELVGGG